MVSTLAFSFPHNIPYMEYNNFFHNDPTTNFRPLTGYRYSSGFTTFTELLKVLFPRYCTCAFVFFLNMFIGLTIIFSSNPIYLIKTHIFYFNFSNDATQHVRHLSFMKISLRSINIIRNTKFIYKTHWKVLLFSCWFVSLGAIYKLYSLSLHYIAIRYALHLNVLGS